MTNPPPPRLFPRLPFSMIQFKEPDENAFMHKIWVDNIKTKNFPPISKPASEVTPKFYPVRF